ncbi:MAG TPA: calcium-binding protein [Actinomycetota bacterium]|nr:calcium-binding protein [Actinomycetota bacterium]
MKLRTAALAAVLTAGLVSTATPAAAAQTCADRRVTIRGTAGPDVIVGTTGRDVIVGRGGSDKIRGRGGNDVICGGAGNDRIRGGRGDDDLHGLSGRDIVSGGSGNDSLFGYGAGDRPRRDRGDDLRGGPGRDLFDIEDFFFCCEPDRGRDRVRGGRGPDRISDSEGNELLNGGAGQDEVVFGDATHADLSTGEARSGDETNELIDIEDLTGSHASDTLIGDAGPNVLFDGLESSGDDHLVGGAGDDTLRTSLGADIAEGGEGNDDIHIYCCVDDSDGDDTYLGGAGDDRISAGLGGADRFEGGDGVDVVSWDNIVEPVDADLQTGRAEWRGQTSTLAEIENLRGSGADDNLRGDDGDNHIEGRGGDDTLDGRAGTDVLDGGDGSDTCTNGETTSACEA